jgi:hypothetical protein
LFFESDRLAILLSAIELFVEVFDDIFIDVKPVADKSTDVLFIKDAFVDELFAA